MVKTVVSSHTIFPINLYVKGNDTYIQFSSVMAKKIIYSSRKHQQPESEH